MPRQARLVFPGVALHIVQRGNNRAACFHRDGDYLLYLLHLRELARKFDCGVHAFCLMPNHVHLLLTPGSPDACSALMRNLGQRYVQHFNRSYGRSGTLWEGRYRSCLVESARYVLACYRYIECNPVRASLVDDAADYPWSSYATNARGRDDRLVSPHAEFLALGNDAEMRRTSYRGLFQQALEPSLLENIRNATNSGCLLASDAFKARLSAMGLKTELGRPGRPTKRTEEEEPASLEIGL